MVALPDLRSFPAVTLLRPLPGGHRNVAWLVQSGQDLLVAKSTRRDSAQLHWLLPVQRAARQAGFIVPPLLRASCGHFAPHGWTLEPFVKGRHAELADLPALAPALKGFHQAAAPLAQRPGFHSLCDLQRHDQSGDIDLTTLPPDLCQSLRRAWARVSPTTMGIIHGDFGPGNLIMTPQGPALIDWDEARLDWLFLDCAVQRSLPSDQAQAHLAYEIASGWHTEPDHARQLVRDLHP